MRRLTIFLSLVVGVLAIPATASGASTTTTVQTVNSSFSETDTCGFQLDWTLHGSFKVTDFFDNSGTLVKEVITNTGGAFTITVTNPANGKIATTQSSAVAVITTFNADGSINTTSSSGVGLNFVLPGTGTIAQEVGTAVFDSEGNLLRIGGPHQFSSGELAGFCSALADPSKKGAHVVAY